MDSSVVAVAHYQTEVGACADSRPEIVRDAMHILQAAAGHKSPGIATVVPGSRNCKIMFNKAISIPIHSIVYVFDILKETVLRICLTEDKMRHFCIMRQGISIFKTSSSCKSLLLKNVKD